MKRLITFAALIAVLTAVWVWPLPQLHAGPFTHHMIRHMLLVAVAAPLIAALLQARTPGPCSTVMIATVAEFIVVWAWHLPSLHSAAADAVVVRVVEQLTFLVAGVFLWRTALDRRQPLAGACGLLLTSMHMTLLGALLVLAPRPLYTNVMDHGVSLDDQQFGGMLMLAIGTPIYLAAALMLVWVALEKPRGRERA